MRVRRLPSGLVVPWQHPSTAEMHELAEATGARMGWDYPQTTGGGGLPSGGSPLQTVLNTAPGTGTWQDIINALVAGSGNVVLSSSGHQASIDLSAANKAILSSFSSSLLLGSAVQTGAYSNSATDNSSFTTVTGCSITFATGSWPALLMAWGEFTTTSTTLTVTRLWNGSSAIGASTANTMYASSGRVTTAQFGIIPANTASATYSFQAVQNGGTSTLSTDGQPGQIIAVSLGFTATTFGLVPIAKSAAFNYNANDWAIMDTTGGTFAGTLPGSPADGVIVAGTWKAGAVAPTFTGGTVLGSPTFGAIGNTIWLRFSTVASAWLVV